MAGANTTARSSKHGARINKSEAIINFKYLWRGLPPQYLMGRDEAAPEVFLCHTTIALSAGITTPAPRHRAYLAAGCQPVKPSLSVMNGGRGLRSFDVLMRFT